MTTLLRATTTVVVLVATALAVSGCGADGDRGSTTSPGTTATSQSPPPTPEQSEQNRPEAVAPSHCPPGLPSCRAVEGRIAYVEAVDPDGDGDAHFVIVDLPGISLPGLTAIDVRKGLRPQPLPGVGDLISAAGPVQEGSYGQDQVHALELHVGSGGD